MKGHSGSVTSRPVADGLAVTCQCGRSFEIALDGQHACSCGWRHQYDGVMLLSRPAGVTVGRDQIHGPREGGA